jgi:thiol:disulfide interchange protein DsbC
MNVNTKVTVTAFLPFLLCLSTGAVQADSDSAGAPVTRLVKSGAADARNLTQAPEYKPDVAQQQKALRQLQQNLAARYPGTAFKEIRLTLMEGVFEVRVGRNVAYTDQYGQYFLFGHLFDMLKQKDLTEARLKELARIDFQELPKGAAIVIKKGTGKRHLAVFSDPDCPFCRRLEQELEKVSDVTIHLYLMPLRIHRDAKAKSIAVWCAGNPQKVWSDMMVRNVEPPTDKACPHPIERIQAYATQQSITATPTMVRADGRVHSGAMTTAQIERWLNGISVQKP